MCSPVTVDRTALERWWSRVERSGSFYKASSGESFESFQDSLVNGQLVYEWPWGLLWFEGDSELGWILHPVLWGASSWRAFGPLEETIADARKRLGFTSLYVRFPEEQGSLERLARHFGFKDTGFTQVLAFRVRPARCKIFKREFKDG